MDIKSVRYIRYILLSSLALVLVLPFLIEVSQTNANPQRQQRRCNGEVSILRDKGEFYIRYEITEEVVSARAYSDREAEINGMVDTWKNHTRDLTISTVLLQLMLRSGLFDELFGGLFNDLPDWLNDKLLGISNTLLLSATEKILIKLSELGPLYYVSEWKTYFHGNEGIPENEFWIAIPTRLLTPFLPTLVLDYLLNPGSIAYLMCYESQPNTDTPIETLTILPTSTPNHPHQLA